MREMRNAGLVLRSICVGGCLVLSASMMLRYSFDLDKEADAIDNAVKKVLNEGYRTGDIYSEGTTKVNCSKMGDLIAERI